MPSTLSRLVDAVSRRVEQRDWRGRPAWAVVAERTYDTGCVDLWDALTDPERLRRWFMPVSGDLRSGGRYQIEGNASGIIETCEPPHRLGVTWEYAGGIGWVVVTLAPQADGTARLVLEHIAHEDPAFSAFWDQFGPGAVGVGWDISLLGLHEHLSSGGKALPRDEAVWLKSGDGRNFAELASEAWGEAAIASGTPAEAAREAARRTRDFYTGGGEGQGAEQRD